MPYLTRIISTSSLTKTALQRLPRRFDASTSEINLSNHVSKQLNEYHGLIFVKKAEIKDLREFHEQLTTKHDKLEVIREIDNMIEDS